MIALAFIAAALIYISLWLWGTRRAYRWARSRGSSVLRSMGTASLAFLAGYLLVFWDLIPTVVVHKSYCTEQAGFFVFTSVDAWIAENRDVAGRLRPYGKTLKELPTAPGMDALINERFATTFDIQQTGFWPVKRMTTKVLDVQRDVVMAEKVDFQRGYGAFGNATNNQALKFWLTADSCWSPQQRRSTGELASYVQQLIDMGEKQ